MSAGKEKQWRQIGPGTQIVRHWTEKKLAHTPEMMCEKEAAAF